MWILALFVIDINTGNMTSDHIGNFGNKNTCESYGYEYSRKISATDRSKTTLPTFVCMEIK